MDQDAFRQLLGSRQSQPKQASPATANNGKASVSASSGPAFKPRNVKKAESKYRDRAAERRAGTANDYAQVEAVLEDFEKRVAQEDRNVIEQQRKYLGGDSQHTILVKGLDMSLLEQNRARVATSAEDEVLERAFTEATTTVYESTEPRKRTREDIIRDLKAKRQSEDKPVSQPAVNDATEDKPALDATKKTGKFRPIGFKPIGQAEDRSKKRKAKEGKEGVKKRKKQKVEGVGIQSETNYKPVESIPVVAQEHEPMDPSSSRTPLTPPELEPAPLDDDFDIFTDAGDYEAFPGEESEEEHRDREEIRMTEEAVTPIPVHGSKNWFGEPERQDSVPLEEHQAVPKTEPTEEEPEEIRLKPLESSALPSIRDFLAMDEAVEKAEKRKARKEKKKKKKGDDDD